MKIIQLELKTKHFKNTDYVSNCDCAIAKAFKDVKKNVIISERVDFTLVYEKEPLRKGIEKITRYDHEEYPPHQFEDDALKAKSSKNPDEVIRVITLKEVKV